MSSPTFVEITPTPESLRARVQEIAGDDLELLARLTRVKDFNKKLRVNEVYVTNTCNLRCDGCWFFGHGMDEDSVEIRDLDTIRAFAEGLKEQGVTGTLLIGGEPGLVPERLSVFADVLDYVTVVTNGVRPIPREGLENVALLVSVWGGGPLDDQLRGHKPSGAAMSGLFEMALRAYKDDPRTTWVYTLSATGLPYMESTVRAIAENNNQVAFGAYSEYGAGHPVRLDEDRRILDEMIRLKETYPKTVCGHPYYYETLVTGRSHWATFGYDTCACISVDYPGNAERLQNGNRFMPGMNTWRPDHTVQMCPLSGDCDGCRDSLGTWVWILANMVKFLDCADRLRTWVELAEAYYREYRWSPWHPAAKEAGGA